MDKNDENPRAEGKHLCRYSFVGVHGIEWICIKPTHNQAYQRKSTDPQHQGLVDETGSHPERPWGTQAPPADRHYFVNRYPYR